MTALLEGDDASVSGRAARLRELVERATGGDSSDPAARGGRAVADVGSADEAFRVLRPVSDGRERPLDTDGRGPSGTLIRVAFWPGQLTAVLTAIRAAADAMALDPAICGSAGAGVLEVSVPAEAAADSVADFVAVLRAGLDGLSDGLPPSRASAVVLSAPPVVQDAVDVWGPVPSLALMRAVKDQFDPGHRMAPGRFAGGI